VADGERPFAPFAPFARSHAGTPPSVTWMTCEAPWRASRLAATACALSGGADDGDRSLRVDPLGHLGQRVVRRLDRPRDVAGVPLAALANVEDLQLLAVRVEPPQQIVDRQALDPRHRPALLAPTRHAAVQEPRDVADADRRRQPRRARGVLVVASDEDDLLLVVGDPGKARAEPRVERGDADGARQ